MNREVKRLRPSDLQTDTYTLNALQGIVDYSPAKPELSISNLLTVQQSMQEKQQIETQKEGEMKAARDNAVKAERAFHEAILSVKDQIRAQFGSDSDEYQSIGMKKKSERKSPKKKSD
jgi:hypothetical protein